MKAKFSKKLNFKRIQIYKCYKFILLFFVLLFSSQLLSAQQEFVNVKKLIPGIYIDMRYATSRNFTGKVIYGTSACFLREKVARRLARVQKRLLAQSYSLKIWDAYRPKSAQVVLWKATPRKLRRYVANPKKGSKHSRGAAVDVTLVDSLGNDCEMPTKFDDFSIRARSSYPNHTRQAIKHRTILHNAMKAEGFLSVSGEWWHFNDPEWRIYSLSNISLKQLLGNEPK